MFEARPYLPFDVFLAAAEGADAPRHLLPEMDFAFRAAPLAWSFAAARRVRGCAAILPHESGAYLTAVVGAIAPRGWAWIRAYARRALDALQAESDAYARLEATVEADRADHLNFIRALGFEISPASDFEALGRRFIVAERRKGPAL